MKRAIDRLIGSAAVHQAEFEGLRAVVPAQHDQVRGFVYEVETGRVREVVV